MSAICQVPRKGWRHQLNLSDAAKVSAENQYFGWLRGTLKSLSESRIFLLRYLLLEEKPSRLEDDVKNSTRLPSRGGALAIFPSSNGRGGSGAAAAANERVTRWSHGVPQRFIGGSPRRRCRLQGGLASGSWAPEMQEWQGESANFCPAFIYPKGRITRWERLFLKGEMKIPGKKTCYPPQRLNLLILR